MHALRLLGGTLLLVGLMSSEAVAQKILVPEGPLQAGSQIQVGYSNPGMAGKTVTVTIQGVGYPMPAPTSVNIVLGADGTGSVPWTVPWWAWVAFNECSAEEVQRMVGGSDDQDGTSG